MILENSWEIIGCGKPSVGQDRENKKLNLLIALLTHRRQLSLLSIL